MRGCIDPGAVIDAFRRVVPPAESPVELHAPTFAGNEWAYAKRCLDTGWVSSAGSFVGEFERRIAEYTGVQYAVAVNNGTAALHMALLAAGVEPGDEVLVPALTFIATANAVHYCGAIPHFVDSDERSLGIDPEKLLNYLAQTTRTGGEGCLNVLTGHRIKAVVAMHAFGHPADLDVLRDVCLQYKLELVEDAAEALGSFYKGRHVGGCGRLAAISFNGNKIVTTGGGGMILTNEEPLARAIRHLTTTAKVAHRWEYVHDEIGYNFRMPNLNAAVGCAQLEQLSGFVGSKRALALRYKQAFEQVSGVRLFLEPEYARSNYWLNALLLEEANREARDLILQKTNDAGLMTRPCWTLLHKLSMYKAHPRMDLSVAENLEDRIINLPSSAKIAFASDGTHEGGRKWNVGSKSLKKGGSSIGSRFMPP